MAKRLPTEFAINMNLEKMMILQQADLQYVNKFNYFDENNPCHLYFICKRPRLTINPDKFEISNEFITLTFVVQKKNKFEEFEFKFKHNFETEDIQLVSEYPNNIFKLVSKGEIFFDAKVSPFLQSFPQFYDFLNLEILYIGQSYGVEGARTAPDRLKNHSTLQGIYSEAISNNPDSEIWLALASFSELMVTMMDGRTRFTEEELKEDNERRPKVLEKFWDGINEQQKINFTEAALIRYFRPKYNIIYKDSFPNPAHKTYSECYDLDINAVCIELQTSEMINCYMYSEAVKKAPWHMHSFLLNSTDDRKSMFEFI